MSAPVPPALRRAAERAVRADPDILAVVLFGSRARGDHRDDSDWDLAFLTAGGATDRRAPEEFRAPGGLDLDCLRIPVGELARKANALAHISCPIVREGRLVAGVWERPKPGGKPAMEPEEYGNFIGNAVDSLNRAAGEAAGLPHARGPFWDGIACKNLVRFSADAAEYLAKAILGRIGIEFRKTHDLEELAGLFGAAHPELGDRIRALNGSSGRDHVAAYAADYSPEDCRRAMDRLAGAGGLLAEELRAADIRFAALAEELAAAASGMLSDCATALRKAGETAAVPDGSAAAIVIGARPGLADALAAAAADLRRIG